MSCDSEEVRREVAFLLDRLRDFENEIDDEELVRTWDGHVVPPMSRLRALLSRLEARTEPAREEAGGELSNCPFCGAAAGPNEQVAYLGSRTVRCYSCGAEGPDGDTPDEAMAGWNRREPARPAREGEQEPVAGRWIPESAWQWLMGEGPAPDGTWFGDSFIKEKHGAYWWRSVFQQLCAAHPASPDARQNALEEAAAEVRAQTWAFTHTRDTMASAILALIGQPAPIRSISPETEG